MNHVSLRPGLSGPPPNDSGVGQVTGAEGDGRGPRWATPSGGHIQELQTAVPCSQSSVSATGKRTFHGGRNVLWLHHSTWQPFAPWAYPAPETCICAILELNFEQCLISTDLKGQRTECSYTGLLDSSELP